MYKEVFALLVALMAIAGLTLPLAGQAQPDCFVQDETIVRVISVSAFGAPRADMQLRDDATGPLNLQYAVINTGEMTCYVWVRTDTRELWVLMSELMQVVRQPQPQVTQEAQLQQSQSTQAPLICVDDPVGGNGHLIQNGGLVPSGAALFRHGGDGRVSFATLERVDADTQVAGRFHYWIWDIIDQVTGEIVVDNSDYCREIIIDYWSQGNWQAGP